MFSVNIKYNDNRRNIYVLIKILALSTNRENHLIFRDSIVVFDIERTD